MAKKSKTQRAKASAARQAKKEQAQKLEAEGVAKAVAEPEPAEQKKSLFKRNTASDTAVAADKEDKSPAKKSEKDDKNKKPSLWKRATGFFKDVRGELKRVTWPSKQDVLRWSAVVVVALLFFGIYVVILDGIVTQILVGISGLSNLVQ